MSLDMGLIGLQAIGGLFGASQENSQAQQQAAVLEENARLTELQGNLDASEAARASRRQEGEIAAALAGSGTMGGTGSGQDILYQTALEREYEIMNVRFGAGQQARNLRDQAAQTRAAGKAALLGGVLKTAVGAIAGVRDLRNGQQARADVERLRSAQLPNRIPVPAGLQQALPPARPRASMPPSGSPMDIIVNNGRSWGF